MTTNKPGELGEDELLAVQYCEVAAHHGVRNAAAALAAAYHGTSEWAGVVREGLLTEDDIQQSGGSQQPRGSQQLDLLGGGLQRDLQGEVQGPTGSMTQTSGGLTNMEPVNLKLTNTSSGRLTNNSSQLTNTSEHQPAPSSPTSRSAAGRRGGVAAALYWYDVALQPSIVSLEVEEEASTLPGVCVCGGEEGGGLHATRYIHASMQTVHTYKTYTTTSFPPRCWPCNL